MFAKFISYISKSPFTTSEIERLKFQIFRLIAAWFGTALILAFTWLTILNFSSATPETAASFYMRMTWIAAGLSNVAIWYLAGSRYYRASVWVFAFVMGALTNNLYAILGTEDVLYRQLIYIFLTLLILSVYLRKLQFYLTALTIYLSFVVNMYVNGHLTLTVLLPMTVASSFAIAAIGFVSKLSAAEAELREQERARALHASRLSTLGETTAFLVHEVSSPLTILSGHLELLQKKEDAEYHIGKMKNALDRAIEFITSVKKMVRSTQPNEYEILQLSEILKMVSDLVEPGLKRKGVRLEFDYADDLELKCRPAEIAQVIINLVNNSADALSSQTDRWIKVFCNVEGKCLNIEVSDPGTGIDASVATRIMDPFFTTKPTGSGIGLSIAQQVARHHDGRIDIVKLKDPTIVRMRVAITPSFVRSGNKSIGSPHSPRPRKQPELEA